MALAVHPNDPDQLLAGVWDGANNGQGIYHSSDGGETWLLANGLTSQDERKVPDIVYDPDNPRIVYAATHGGLRYSADGGITWAAYPGVMGGLPITALAVYRGEGEARLYIGTVGGIYNGAFGAEPAVFSQDIFGAGIYVGHSRLFLLHLPITIQTP